ncbi:MAG: histidine phosphatase family protein [Saprospiraceae bacterium]|jgi:phosphohistidine phosphatase
MIVKKVILVRHGKSSWADFALSDHDRPLDERGKKDAPTMADLLEQKGHFPQQIISSTAVRAKTTAQYFGEKFGIAVLQEGDLYHGMPDDYLHQIKNLAPSINCVALFGHNPGITNLANMVQPGCTDNVPTCGIVVLNLPIETDWSKASFKKMTMTDLLYPKDFHA